MEVKGTNIYLQASELPIITDILSGDNFIVQTPSYSTTIKFYDIIIDSNNTTFYSNIPNNQTNIYTISSDTINLSSYIFLNSFLTLSEFNTYTNNTTALVQQSISDVSLKIQDGFTYLSEYYNSQINAITASPLSPKAWVVFDNTLSILRSSPGIDNINFGSGPNAGKIVIVFEEFLIDFFETNANLAAGYGGYVAVATIGGNSTSLVIIDDMSSSEEILITPVYRSASSEYEIYANFEFISVIFYSL